MRALALLAVVLLLAPGAFAAEPDGARLHGALLQVDAGAAEPPMGEEVFRVLHSSEGRDVQLVLPYRKHGTWIRITPRLLPEDPVLVVNGMAAKAITLVLPDGQRIVRTKLEPSTAAHASTL